MNHIIYALSAENFIIKNILIVTIAVQKWTERKMNMKDEEIIEALECCTSPFIRCEFCPLVNVDYCERELIEKCFDLVNRQKEEIERLEIELDAMRGAANSYKFHYNEAKSEAIKEFAERLKNDLFYKCGDLNYTETCDTRRLIDNIVKEMVGEFNA